MSAKANITLYLGNKRVSDVMASSDFGINGISSETMDIELTYKDGEDVSAERIENMVNTLRKLMEKEGHKHTIVNYKINSINA